MISIYKERLNFYMIRIFPNSIKFRITLVTVLFTLIIAIFMASVSFYLFQHFSEENLIQSIKFNIQFIMDSITDDINELIYLTKWCKSNTTILKYLETNPNDIDNIRPLTLEAYERLKEEYRNSKISKYIKRIIISSNNDNQYIQVIGNAFDLYEPNPNLVRNIDFFNTLLNDESIKWIGIIDDPLTKTTSDKVIPIVRPIYSSYNSSVIGWTYITVSSDMITDNFKNYIIPEDSNIYITIGNNTYKLESNKILKLPSTYLEEEQKNAVTCYSSIEGWSITQTLSKKQFREQKQIYHLLLITSCLVIISLGIILTVYMNRVINLPINKIRYKIKQISSGDFSRDPSIEWNNEFGEIGKGINDLSLDVVNLMNKRIADETQKKELEYKILLNQINPHFLYNTLNSIKWMATIQKASGIAEMVTALSRLLKEIAKNDSEFHTLRKELSLLNDYFLIQKYRYGGAISMKFDIQSDDLLDCQILKFTLQPLVENSIFHGIEPKGEEGLICISIKYLNEDDIIITVTDNGLGMTPEEISNILSNSADTSSSFFKKLGIANVKQRIEYAYGKKYGLTIESEVGKYTKISITMPRIID